MAVVAIILGLPIILILVAIFGGESERSWKPEGDCDGENWRRYKMERWEKERREAERRAKDIPVDVDRRSGEDRRHQK